LSCMTDFSVLELLYLMTFPLRLYICKQK
jgi:hypothetical protein